MAKRTFDNVRIQLKRDTAANWEQNNPVLLEGEEILVDTGSGELRKKIGDGTKTYTQLPFTDEKLRTLISAKVDKVSGKGLSSNDFTNTLLEKLNNIDDNANKYEHPVYDDQATSGLYKITVEDGHVKTTTAVQKSDITGLGIPAQDTTYNIATTSEDGLMTKEDKGKLDGIAENAEVNQNAFSNIKIGNSVVEADTKTDTVELVAGTNMQISASEDKITFNATYTHPESHPAEMITEDTSHRFVTDAQITAWNAKAEQSALSNHIDNKNNPHAVTKVQVGLGNVTNDAQVKRSEMGVAGGVATLDNNGNIPSSQLPSYVDDVIEGYYYNSKFHKDSAYTQVITGETGKIYVNLSDSKTYRWSGTQYVIISESLALGETSSTAYPGDKGKANAAAIVTINEKLSTIDDLEARLAAVEEKLKSAVFYG